MDRHRLSFQELIEHLEDKQEWAVRELVDRYGHHVLRVVRRHLGRRMRVRFDSEDFVQAVWATLFVKSTAFDDIQTEPQLIAFLTQVAFHKVIDERRAHTLIQRRNLNREIPISEQDSQVNRVSINQTTPSEYVMAEEELDLLRREIPLELQWMLECRMRGMTFDDIARQGGINERTVRRVFERLKRKLGDQ